MYGTTDPIARKGFITSLRVLVDYLTTHPDVPVPPAWNETKICIHATGTQAERYAEVDHIAALLDAPVKDDTANGGHYSTEKVFGAIVYSVVAISDAYTAQANADDTYRGCVSANEATAVH